MSIRGSLLRELEELRITELMNIRHSLFGERGVPQDGKIRIFASPRLFEIQRMYRQVQANPVLKRVSLMVTLARSALMLLSFGALAGLILLLILDNLTGLFLVLLATQWTANWGLSADWPGKLAQRYVTKRTT